ncbi:glycerol-3-phosphate acyltransferase mitochondrial [Brachionus plicatilis]|uniref:Glycerol-3-phosphate acyltransferase mitochondrial n=1 Tax=Brachionus plicatilis TaxID=10195 RepID=A0A3M7QQ87_BRAPC|nr:glycerol-3-phosphate acyltransferase mitochondrial [Brachionus plicatilis]
MQINSDSLIMNDNQFLQKIVSHVYEKKVEIREPIPFKSSPFWIPHEIYSQSGLFKKCCIDCSPNSTVYYEAKNKNYLFLNLFKTPRIYQEQKNLTNILKEYNNPPALENKRLRDYSTETINQKILNILCQIESNIRSKQTIKATLIVMNLLLRLVYDKIICYQLHLSALRTAHDKQLPIVYVLKTNSFMDRLIVQMTLFMNNFRISNVLWCLSENVLNDGVFKNKLVKYFFGLSNFRMINETELFKSEQNKNQSGFDELEKYDDSLIYRKTIMGYLMEELKNENDIIIQNNSLNLQDIVELTEKELIHDVLIVPVSVSYEKFLDRLFDLKSYGQICFKWLKLILNGFFLNKTNGQVRVNFGQPFSLNGCDLTQLCHKVLEVKNFLAFSYQIGFNFSKIEDVIHYTVELLSDLIVSDNFSHCQNNNAFIRPRNNQSIKELFYHGKILIEIFFLKSIIAKSINQLVKHDLHFVIFERRSSYLEINENDLIKKCFGLISIFQHEFNMFKKPCETVFSRLNRNINDLINMDVLIDQKAKQYDGNYARLNKVFKNQYDDDDWNSDENEEFYSRKFEQYNSSQTDLNPDEEEIASWKPFRKPKIYKVNRSQISKLMFFAKIIDPLVEGYFRFLETIKVLKHDKIYQEDEILNLIKNENLMRTQTGKVKSMISTDSFLTRSAFNFCVNVGIFDKIQETEKEIVKLSIHSDLNGRLFSLNENSEIKISKYWVILKSSM